MSPIEHRLIRRLGIADSSRRRNGRCDIFHEATPKAFLSPVISGLSILRLEQGTLFAASAASPRNFSRAGEVGLRAQTARCLFPHVRSHYLR